MKEKELQTIIMSWLDLHKIFHYRNNSGAMLKEVNGKKYFMRFGALGSPDIVAVINGQYVGIEVKGDKGKQSDHQKAFQESLEKAGGKYILAYHLNDVVDNIAVSN